MQSSFLNILLVLFLEATFFQNIHAQNPELKFTHFTSRDGLSQNTVYDIHQDYKGMIWIATQEGLNKFDGTKFTVYKNKSADSASLSNNYVIKILEDKNKNLWFGTGNGLNRYDRAKNNFKIFKKNNNPKSIVNSYISELYEDKAGVLWIGTTQGLCYFKPEDESFVSYDFNSDVQRIKGHSGVVSIFEDSKGNFWVGTNGSGLYLFDRNTGKFKNYQYNPDDPFSLSNDRVYIIREGFGGKLWIGTWGGGLNLFDPLSGKFIRYTYNENDPKSLGGNTIFDMLMDWKGRFWIGTENGGLNLFDPNTGKFKRYFNNEADKSSVSNNSVSALMEDKTHALWIGVHRGGINYYNPEGEKFKLYQKEYFKNSISNNNIKAFCEDKEGNLWIGTDGGGLNKFDRKTGTFEHFLHNKKDPYSISNNVVLSIFEDKNQNLWVGTFGGGLNKLDKKTRRFYHYVNDLKDSNSIQNNYIWSMCEDKEGNLWLGTRGNGINIFNTQSRNFKSLKCGNTTNDQVSSCWVNYVFKDKDHNIWVGTTFGLNYYNIDTHTFTQFYQEEGNKNSIGSNDINCIYQDSKARIWVGTTKGLSCFEKKRSGEGKKGKQNIQKIIKTYKEEDGLLNDNVVSIGEDDQGNLWLGTLKGIIQFNPEKLTFKNYNVSDGLQENEFTQNAFLKAQSGEMFFGGINGFNSFYPERVKDNPFIPPVYITNLLVFNKTVVPGKNSILKESISEAREIVLSYKHSVFSFEFAALNYLHPEKNQYAYQMEGFDDKWTEAGNKGNATYTNLNPGTYTFKVKASNNDGIWNDQPASVKIVITPPYWQTWWFKSLICAAIVATLTAWYKAKINTERRQKRILEQKVKLRTSELQRANVELTEQKGKILDQKEELRNQSEKMEALYMEIKDSIRAAQVIQESILPSHERMRRYFKDFFILNLPKDVVSGDFYWFDVKDDKIIIAAVDCTGHGVSGAFMSINGHHLLNQIIHSQLELSAAGILDKLNQSVIHELNHREQDLKILDGMDIALCIIDKKGRHLQFAGANNPLYILRDKEIIQVKPDRFSIGLSINGKSIAFKNNQIDMLEDDVYYIFSDGYADQFGGEKGEEKFMYSRMRNLFQSIGSKPLHHQLEELKSTLADWKSELDQLDDILVIGFKI